MRAGCGRDCGPVFEGTPPEGGWRPGTVSRDGVRMVVVNGVTVTPDGRFEDCLAPDVVVVPELSVGNEASLLQDLSPEVAWLRRWYGAGATIATACSGAVVLAETGLLDGQSATTHWAYCDGLQERHPGIHVQGDRALVVAGEGQRLLMAGGGASWMDMALFLISRLLGVEAAVRMARLNLIDWHDVGQQPLARKSTRLNSIH